LASSALFAIRFSLFAKSSQSELVQAAQTDAAKTNSVRVGASANPRYKRDKGTEGIASIFQQNSPRDSHFGKFEFHHGGAEGTEEGKADKRLRISRIELRSAKCPALAKRRLERGIRLEKANPRLAPKSAARAWGTRRRVCPKARRACPECVHGRLRGQTEGHVGIIEVGYFLFTDNPPGTAFGELNALISTLSVEGSLELRLPPMGVDLFVPVASADEGGSAL